MLYRYNFTTRENRKTCTVTSFLCARMHDANRTHCSYFTTGDNYRADSSISSSSSLLDSFEEASTTVFCFLAGGSLAVAGTGARLVDEPVAWLLEAPTVWLAQRLPVPKRVGNGPHCTSVPDLRWSGIWGWVPGNGPHVIMLWKRSGMAGIDVGIGDEFGKPGINGF